MSKPVILCVDDEKIVLVSLKDQLKRHFGKDYTIETVESGDEALGILNDLLEESVEVPLVISDQIMPGMKGDELLRQIHRLSPQTLKVLLTGQASAEAVGNAVNHANLYRYIAKPWEQTDLVLTVTEATRSYFREQKLHEQNQILRKFNKELESVNRELDRKIDIFYKFVPNQFLKVLKLEDQYDRIELGACVEETMTVMFSDMRSFTMLSEQLTPEENFRFLNSYLSHMGPIIRKYNGFIDKYIGDAIMALFTDADAALQTAINMMYQLTRYNDGRRKAGFIPVQIGIGLNTGELILGTIGEDDRMQTTVIGDRVNLAARIEDLTKIYQTPLLITEDTYHALKDPTLYSIRRIDRVQVRGKKYPVTIFEVLDVLSSKLRKQKMAIVKPFEKALSLYQEEKYEEAGEIFGKCLDKAPDDTVIQIHLNRCQSQLNP